MYGRPTPTAGAPNASLGNVGGPLQDRGRRIVVRRLGQPSEENVVGEVVLQPVTAQLGDVRGIEIVRSPSGDPGV